MARRNIKPSPAEGSFKLVERHPSKTYEAVWVDVKDLESVKRLSNLAMLYDLCVKYDFTDELVSIEDSYGCGNIDTDIVNSGFVVFSSDDDTGEAKVDVFDTEDALLKLYMRV
jgi:hypothetical protein